MACGLITSGSTLDCTAIPKGGTKPRIVVMNYDEIDAVTTSSDIVTGITLVSGASAYVFSGFKNDIKKTEEIINLGTGVNWFKHGVGWVIYERTQAIKNQIENLARGRYVCIVENRGKDNAAFEVVGLGSGLEVVIGSIRSAHENGGAYILSFATADGENEDKLPQVYFDTSYTQTLSEINALAGIS